MADPIMTKTIFVSTEPVTSPKSPSPLKENEGNQTPEVKQEKAPAYENIVSVSEDGDTVQVKPEANERLSDGFVFAKAADEKADDKKEEEESSAVQEAIEMNEKAKEALKAQLEEARKKDEEKSADDKQLSGQTVNNASDSDRKSVV